MSQLSLDILPTEIREKIYQELIRLSTKSKEFKSEIQSRWSTSRTDRLLHHIYICSEAFKDNQIEQALYDADELDLESLTRTTFHQKLKNISLHLTPDSLKTRWMFHIFGYDATTLQYLNAHIGKNYLRGYITHDGYLLGYLLLADEHQEIHSILGRLSYYWRIDCMLLNRIDQHVNRFQIVSAGNYILREDLLRKTISLSHKTVCSDSLIEGHLEEMLPDAYHRDILPI